MTYNDYCHADEIPGSLRAADRIIPVVLELLGEVQSAVDLGGGTGGWLRALRNQGVDELLLIDRQEVEPHLLVESTAFLSADLNENFPVVGRFDLAICVECAEHLTPDRSEPLVEWLTTVSDQVVFSAAIPGQGGKGHVNERFPAFWNDLFLRRGFVRRDLIRPKIVSDRAIPWWYRQNILLYLKDDSPKFPCIPDYLPVEFVLVHVGDR